MGWFATFLQVAISTTLVVAGAVALTASFGGASVVGATLISAGISGAATSITSAVQGKPASWKNFGKSVAVGAVTGFVGGALGAGAGAVAKGLTTGVQWTRSAILATKAACIVSGSTTSSMTCNAISNGFQGRKWSDGIGIAAATGAAGGLFACGGTALAHSMKRSAIGWIKNPFFRHGVGVGVDTASAAAGGAIGAGMSGQDVGTAAWVGAVTGAASGAFVASVRGGAKHHIRKQQALERTTRSVGMEPIERDVVTFEFRNDNHVEDLHVDKHHGELKQRLNTDPNIPASSRFKDLETAYQMRRKLAEGYSLPAEVVAAKQQHTAATEQLSLANDTVDACRATYAGNRTPETLQQLNAALQTWNGARANARTALLNLRTEVNNLKVGSSIPVAFTNNKKIGYGYHRDGPNATGPVREFNIKNTRSYFVPSVAENGAITFRETTSHPEYVSGNKTQKLWQNLQAGDRQFRRRAVGNDVVRRAAGQYRQRDEENTLAA